MTPAEREALARWLRGSRAGFRQIVLDDGPLVTSWRPACPFCGRARPRPPLPASCPGCGAPIDERPAGGPPRPPPTPTRTELR